MATLDSLFSNFNNSIKVPQNVLDNVDYRIGRIKSALDTFYWGFTTTNKLIMIGSIGRKTDIHTSDVDVVYLLPATKYTQYDAYAGNGQQALLQEFRQAILSTYPQTEIKSDGLVIVVAFSDGITLEIMPAFLQADDSVRFPVANNGGSWRKADPFPEIAAMNKIHTSTKRNARKLARMVRAWKEYNGVSMGGLQIDTYVERFLKNYEYAANTYTYFDWMTRDFFKFLANENDEAAYILALGSNQQVYQKGKFCKAANRAYELAKQAETSFTQGYHPTAVGYWSSIYGPKFKLV
jgi:Second Messenger Oligonucleotide or Dinucleotide Synthetase domain